MIIDILLITLGLAGLIFASVTDLKTREVPDWLNFSLISIGFALRLIHSLTYNDWPFFLYALLGFSVMFIVGNLMYYLKQWGGGDTKLLMALGVIFATSPKFLTQRLDSLPFLLILFINIILAGAVYGLIYSIYLALKNKRKFTREIKNLLPKYKKYRNISLLLSLLLIIAGIFIKIKLIKLSLLMLALLVLIYLYAYIFIRAIENSCMLKVISAKDLTPGDWVISQKLISRFKISNLGIEESQIEAIKKSNIKQLIVKEGIPFVPSFLLGTLLSLILGNIFYFLF